MEIIGTSKQSTVINTSNICDALHDLRHLYNLKNVKTPPWMFFSLFLNWTNGTKSGKPSQMV